MRIFTLTLAIFLLWFGSAVANDDHIGECEIEEWRSYSSTGASLRKLIIEGSATCASGFVAIRLYEGTGESRTFIGTADGVIRGYAFSATTAFYTETKQESLSIEYSIEAEEADTVNVECEIEEWQSHIILGKLLIEGSTTCDSGFVAIRLYEGTGESRTFIGTADGVIEEHAFSVKTAFHVETKPSSLSMIAVIAKDVVVMAGPDIQNDITIPADRSSISLDFSNSVSLLIAFTGGEVANQIISVKQISTSNIAEEFPTVPAFTNAVHYIDMNFDVHNSEAALTFGYNEETVTGLSLNEDSLVVSVYDSLDARGFIWHVLPSTIDTDNNTITVTTDHFSLWVVANSTEALITAVDDAESVPRQFGLNPNYPNPFNPVTTITYNLDRTGIVVLTIYDVPGREVRTLVNTQQVSGSNTVVDDEFFYGRHTFRLSRILKLMRIISLTTNNNNMFIVSVLASVGYSPGGPQDEGHQIVFLAIPPRM